MQTELIHLKRGLFIRFVGRLLTDMAVSIRSTEMVGNVDVTSLRYYLL